jgi:hypothetical protein
MHPSPRRRRREEEEGRRRRRRRFNSMLNIRMSRTPIEEEEIAC